MIKMEHKVSELNLERFVLKACVHFFKVKTCKKKDQLDLPRVQRSVKVLMQPTATSDLLLAERVSVFKN